MKHMSLNEIAHACSGIYHGDPALALREVEMWPQTAGK